MYVRNYKNNLIFEINKENWSSKAKRLGISACGMPQGITVNFEDVYFLKKLINPNLL